MPRQAYGIDFYGHEQGEILVAVDLCTREAILWFLPNRKQENVARALLTGLVLQKGVPLSFRNDEAPEFVKGVVAAMNRYLGIEQITTGSHNPRSNAVVERFMQHLNGCLTKCDDSQYKNMKDFLPAIAFAHNTAFNSAINCTPFEKLDTASGPKPSPRHVPVHAFKSPQKRARIYRSQTQHGKIPFSPKSVDSLKGLRMTLSVTPSGTSA